MNERQRKVVAIRADIRERLRAVADEMLLHQDTHVVLVSRQVADTLRVWSEPAQIRFEPGESPGILDLVCRNLATTREDEVHSA